MRKVWETFVTASAGKSKLTHAIGIFAPLLFLTGTLVYGQAAAVDEGFNNRGRDWPLHNVNQARTCAATTDAEYTMVIQSPCSPNVIADNQVAAPAPSDIAITDLSAAIVAEPLPIQVKAPGMKNIEIWTHSSMATRLTERKAGSGIFSGVLDLSKESAGPLSVRFVAWNTPPGDNSYTVQLTGIMDLFVDGAPAKMPFPAGAAGMKLVWEDDFNKLNAGSCLKGTGAWPNCTYVSAQDGYTWFESEPNVGGNFGDAAFESSADADHDPFKVEHGFLRIRSTYDPNYVDPYGYGRHWYSGILATIFPDGSSNVPLLQNGYYEARILTPDASAGADWSPNDGGDYPQWYSFGGGTWPAFWMVNSESLQPNSAGSLEEDVTEQYGESEYYDQVAQHVYGNGTGPTDYIYHSYPGPDLTADFHRYGLLVTDTTVTAYLDDQPLGTLAKGELPGIATPDWYVMLDLAMGGGWPENIPPSRHYDMWIDYVRYFAPR